MKTNSAELAYTYMANNPGRTYAYGDFLRLLRQPNGERLPEGTAIGQRLSSRYNSDQLGPKYASRIYLENDKHGCIAEVRYYMTRENAARYLADQARRRAERERKAS